MNDIVSIIIPLYNHERYIQDLLKSINQISYKNIEVIVCDDMSMDRSYETCKEWLEKNTIKYKLFRNRKNLGVSKTLNVLLSMATGKYIVPIASDDVLVPFSIENRVSLFESDKNTDLIVADSDMVDEQGRLLKNGVVASVIGGIDGLSTDEITIKIIKNWCLPGSIYMFRKQIIRSIGMYNETLLHEDEDFFLRAVSNVNVLFISDIVCKYRVHDYNSSTKRELRTTLEHINVCCVQLIKTKYKFAIIIRISKLFMALLVCFYKGTKEYIVDRVYHR